MNSNLTPAQAWENLKNGNQRFTSGQMLHPSQGFTRREELTVAQNPFAVIFGCSDSRVAAELIFDQGLGDVFVVRTAGHVLDTTVIGSIEYGVDVLETPLVVVLGHDSCGAVGAAVNTLQTGHQQDGFVRAVVDRVIPSIVNITSRTSNGTGEKDFTFDANTLRNEHVKHTMSMLHSYSRGIADAVATGRCAIVGLVYDLADGQARLVDVIGDIGEEA